MTQTRQDLLEALGQVQNFLSLVDSLPVDIMTITGCGMSDDEVRRHLEANIEYVQRKTDALIGKRIRRRRAH